MQEKGFSAAALCIVLMILTQQVCAGPLVPRVQESSGPAEVQVQVQVPVLKRTARMTPLWRIMNSKPVGAYCQNNYECTTALCRAGRCSSSHRPPSETVNY